MTKTSFIVWTAALGAAVFWCVATLRDPAPEPVTAPKSAEPNLFSFVRSMEGTRTDGAVNQPRGNELVVDRELRNLFEYYLAATGEKPLPAIQAEIERELERRLPAPQASQAKQLLARYLDYKRELVDVEKNPAVASNELDAIRARLLALRQARQRHFNEREIDGMFGMEDAYDGDALARMEISRDKSLSAEQKREKLASLDAALPPELREAREVPLQAARLADQAAKMRAQGASDDDVYRMRAAAVGPEAAARLAAVDREENAWQSRIATYLGERKKLIDNGNPADVSRQTALQQLRDTYFTPDEQRRLAAYEPGS